jgi:hypothetical protein
MMVKSAQPAVRMRVHARPPPFILSTIQVMVYAPTKSADTRPLFLLYPYMYSMVLTSGACTVVSIDL